MNWPDDAARLIYLVVLAAFIATYFLSDLRNRLNQTLQMVAVWALIFMAAIAAYSFRDLVGGQLFSSSPQVGAGGFSIQRQDDGHFYLILQANGQDVEFVVDTGASDIVLNQGDAAAIGIDVNRLDFAGQANTANGVVRIAEARLATLIAPGMELYDVRVSVNGGELDKSLLGMSYLNRFRGIAIEGDVMTLTP